MLFQGIIYIYSRQDMTRFLWLLKKCVAKSSIDNRLYNGIIREITNEEYWIVSICYNRNVYSINICIKKKIYWLHLLDKRKKKRKKKRKDTYKTHINTPSSWNCWFNVKPIYKSLKVVDIIAVYTIAYVWKETKKKRNKV